MSRSGYIADGGYYDMADFLRSCAYNGNLRRHLGGRAGQRFLWELYFALEALPKRALITGALEDKDGAYCALGAVARARAVAIPAELGIEASDEYGPVLEASDFYDEVSGLLDIHEMMAREVMYKNDECDNLHYVPGPPLRQSCPTRKETPEERWYRMRRWVVSKLRDIP
jgi:hypothetical protein